MKNITWSAGKTTDIELLNRLPKDLCELIEPSGGFILHNGAIHFRGCTNEPQWNSIRKMLEGEFSLYSLYPALNKDDTPFAQDLLGDQYILRDSKVYVLEAETGDISIFANSLSEFIQGIEKNIESYLNVDLTHALEPGQLLHAYPPFCTEQSKDSVSLKPVPVFELIQFHADFAKQIRDIPSGNLFSIQIED